jgi:hypothetical protein
VDKWLQARPFGAGLRIFAEAQRVSPVSGSLIVDFDSETKVNRKILWCPVYVLLCLKNRQIGTSPLGIGLKSFPEKNCPQTYPPKMWRTLFQNTARKKYGGLAAMFVMKYEEHRLRSLRGVSLGSLLRRVCQEG